LNGCRKYEDLVARHLHGEALLQDREELEKHLAVCPDCERLYRDLANIDQALREYPGKVVEPPPHLHSRIVANLPEELPPLWGGWGRWAFGFGSAVVAVVALFFGARHLVDPALKRVASAPVPVLAAKPPSPAVTGAVVAPPPAEPVKVAVIKEVKIFFYYPPAQKVAVTGDFNDWNAEGVPLKAAGKPGLWETELRLPPGVYSYNFIVDGELLIPDPNSPNQMPDGYGGTNSILLVKGENPV